MLQMSIEVGEGLISSPTCGTVYDIQYVDSGYSIGLLKFVEFCIGNLMGLSAILEKIAHNRTLPLLEFYTVYEIAI